MAKTFTTHEELFAHELNRLRARARDLDLERTAHYLDIAASKLKDERAEKIAASVARADRYEASNG